MAAPSRIPASAPKRKISDDHDQQPGNKRKSPLFNQPQKFYAPPTIASMTKDELSEWRKEQRRRRNRESAATSRNKTRAKIEELEGEVDKWKLMYHDMEVKTRCMERHIQFLTKLNGSRQGPGGGQQQRMVTSAPLQPPTVVSHPNSPPRSPPPNSVPAVPVLPNAVISFMPPSPAYSSHIVTHPFPALLSEPQDCASVVKREVAADADMFNEEESGKHLITIPRQAVKITGANSDASTDNTKQQQQLSRISMCDPLVKDKESEEVGSIINGDTTEVAPIDMTEVVSIDMTSVNEMVYEGKNPEGLDSPVTNGNESKPDRNIASELGDDGDFLDLLVDTLDGEFDLDLLI